MKKYISIPVYLIIFLSISFYAYSVFLEIFKQPPSDAWSKEVLIGEIENSSEIYPRIMNVGENILVAYQDEGCIKLIMTDKMGGVLKNVEFVQDDKIAKCLNMLQDNNNVYLNWITGTFENKHMNTVMLNKNLEKVSEEKSFGVQLSEQISDNILLLGYKDRIEVLNVNTNDKVKVPVVNPNLIAGTLTDMGYLITYYENKAEFRYFFVRCNKASESKLIDKYIIDGKSLFGRIAVASDKKFGYQITEILNSQKGIKRLSLIKFPLDGQTGKTSDTNLKISGLDMLFGPVAVSSGSEARFLISGYRNYIKTRNQYDVVDFKIKEGNVVSHNYLSRTEDLGMYPATNGTYAVFCDLTGENSYNIFLASQDEAFKTFHSGVVKEDVRRSISEVIAGYCGAIGIYMALGGIWVISGAMLISLFSLNSYKFGIRTNKILFVICCVLTAAVKVYTIYFFYYSNSFPHKMLPELLASPVLGLILVSLISIICYLDGYMKFSNRLKVEFAIPFYSFGGVMLLDTLLSLIMFEPFVL